MGYSVESSQTFTPSSSSVYGLRRGEVFGFTWKSISLHQSTITLTQSLPKEGGLRTKKRSGIRTIPIDAEIGRAIP